MSGAIAFPRPKKRAEGPLEKKLAVEDNRRIVRSVGAGQVFGAWIIAWALTVKFINPILPTPPDVVNPDHEKPPIITFDQNARDRQGKPIQKKPQENKGAKAVSRNPSKEEGVIQRKEIAAQTGDAGLPAYELINKVIKGFDIDKIDNTARLSRTDPTRIAGRPGIKRDVFNPGWSDGDESTTDIDLTQKTLGRIPGGDAPGKTSLTAPVTHIEAIRESRFRSSNDILAVVRAHTPGLRHLYNTHLKANPGLGGKVTVRFAISPGGRVVDAGIDGSTTGSRPFEEQVLAKIRAWKFDAINAIGNDIVTVPFSFSE